jgi:hypothetical protein
MDVQGIIERIGQCSFPPQCVLCTGKDLAKLAIDQIGSVPLWALEIELKVVSGVEVLDDYLDRVTGNIRAE